MMLKFIHLQSWLLKILSLNDDIGIILLDVVMETNTSGLDLVKYYESYHYPYRATW